MKYLFLALVLGANAVEAAPAGPGSRPPADLREAVQQYDRGRTQPPPAQRQLSTTERAELRRQLGQYGRRH